MNSLSSKILTLDLKQYEVTPKGRSRGDFGRIELAPEKEIPETPSSIDTRTEIGTKSSLGSISSRAISSISPGQKRRIDIDEDVSLGSIGSISTTGTATRKGRKKRQTRVSEAIAEEDEEQEED